MAMQCKTIEVIQISCHIFFFQHVIFNARTIGSGMLLNNRCCLLQEPFVVSTDHETPTHTGELNISQHMNLWSNLYTTLGSFPIVFLSELFCTNIALRKTMHGAFEYTLMEQWIVDNGTIFKQWTKNNRIRVESHIKPFSVGRGCHLWGFWLTPRKCTC